MDADDEPVQNKEIKYLLKRLVAFYIIYTGLGLLSLLAIYSSWYVMIFIGAMAIVVSISCTVGVMNLYPDRLTIKMNLPFDYKKVNKIVKKELDMQTYPFDQGVIIFTVLISSYFLTALLYEKDMASAYIFIFVSGIFYSIVIVAAFIENRPGSHDIEHMRGRVANQVARM